MGGLCREVSTLLSAQMCFRRGEALEAARVFVSSLAFDVEALPRRIIVFENPSGPEGNAAEMHLMQR